MIRHCNNNGAATCRIDHEVKGQAIYAFVTLSEEAGKTGDREQIKKALVGHIRSQIGAQASLIPAASLLRQHQSARTMHLMCHLHLPTAGAFAVPEVIHWAPGVCRHLPHLA